MISFIFELTNCGKEQSMEYNVYCDESCHLENDNTNVMAIGAVYCPKDKIKEVSNRIREIKIANGIPKYRELKAIFPITTYLQWLKIIPNFP